MTVILIGMGIAFSIVLNRLPDEVSFLGALDLAGAAGRMNIVDFSLDLDKRYTFWSGITGGLFLALSYFGTDQSQVQRYLSGKSIQESRLGLIFNALTQNSNAIFDFAYWSISICFLSIRIASCPI